MKWQLVHNALLIVINAFYMESQLLWTRGQVLAWACLFFAHLHHDTAL